MKANSSDLSDEGGMGFLFNDIGTFNEVSGIKRVPKQV